MNYENSGSTSAAGHTGNSSVTTDNVSGTHTFVLSGAAVLESRLTYTRDNEPGAANSTDPEAVIRQGGLTAISIGRNNFSPRYTNARTIQWADSLSYVHGRHTFKAGLDMNFQHIDNFFPGNFSGSYTFNSYADFASNKPFSFTQAFAGASTDGPLSTPNVNEYAFYAQDSWRVSEQLTVNYGIRYDLFELANPKVKNPDPGLAAANLDTSLIPIDKNNIGGRLGFAYRLSQNGNTVVRGGVGNYYGRTPSILTGTAFTQNGIQVQTYTLTANLPAYPSILTAPPALNRTPDIYVFAKDYVQPLTWQWSLNVEHPLGRDYAITAGYLGVRGEHLSRTRDINFLPAVPQQGSFADGTPVTYMRHLGRANPAFGRISLFDSGADSIYHGGFIQLSKRFSQNFQVQTSYTFSKVIDSRPGLHLGGGGNRRQQERAGHARSESGTRPRQFRHHSPLRVLRRLGYQLCQVPAEPDRTQSPARLSVLNDRQRAERPSADGHRGRRPERRYQHLHRPAALRRTRHLHRTQLHSRRISGLPATSRSTGTAPPCD